MNKDIYKTSRICYIIEDTVTYLINILISGAYLAHLTSALGFSDSMTAVLASFVNLGCIFQLLAIYVFKQGRVKRKATVLYIIYQSLLMLLYFVPFLKINPAVKSTLFILFLFGGYFIYNIVFSPKTNWFLSLIPDKRRGRFTALKEGISLICGIGFNFSMGTIIDYYTGIGKLSASFAACGFTIFILIVINACSLMCAKEKEPEEIINTSVLSGIRNILSDKTIISIILISALWSICNYISTPFLGTYQIKELGFSMTFVAVLSVVNALVRITASVFLGKYADKTSFADMLKICYFLVAASFGALIFTVPSNGYVMYLIHHMFFSAAMGGINSAEINLIFDHVSPDKRKSTLAIKQTIFGICGFFSTLIVTPLVNHIQTAGNSLFGIHIYSQQVLAAISFVLTLVLIYYINKLIIKEHKKG